MESQPARVLRTAARQYAVVGLLLAALVPSLVAAAATEPGDDGDALSARFDTLDIPVRKLALEIVEHMVINNDKDFAGPADDDDDPAIHADTVAPILLLTPRVASILREVFGNPSATADADANDAQDEDPAPVSPVADSSSSSRTPAATAPLRNDATPNQYVPHYQRQMYRTDI